MTGTMQQETSTISSSLRLCVSESLVTGTMQQATSTVSTSLRLCVRVSSDRYDTAGDTNCFHFITVMCVRISSDRYDASKRHRLFSLHCGFVSKSVVTGTMQQETSTVSTLLRLCVS